MRCCVTRQHVVPPVVRVAVSGPLLLNCSVLNSVPSVMVHLGLCLLEPGLCHLRISQPPDLQRRLGLQEGCVDPVDEVSHPQAGFEPVPSRMLSHHAMFLLQLVLWVLQILSCECTWLSLPDYFNSCQNCVLTARLLGLFLHK